MKGGGAPPDLVGRHLAAVPGKRAVRRSRRATMNHSSSTLSPNAAVPHRHGPAPASLLPRCHHGGLQSFSWHAARLNASRCSGRVCKRFRMQHAREHGGQIRLRKHQSAVIAVSKLSSGCGQPVCLMTALDVRVKRSRCQMRPSAAAAAASTASSLSHSSCCSVAASGFHQLKGPSTSGKHVQGSCCRWQAPCTHTSAATAGSVSSVRCRQQPQSMRLRRSGASSAPSASP